MSTPTTPHTPLAQVERRTHELIEVTGYRVEHGHRVVDGVWATRNGLTVGSARLAATVIPEVRTP